ncbi:MAG: hypothetical protein J6T70_14795 [Bacteroidales bacterium]|nr:hypothetical protein [Bacteroidales bacterium]
MKTTLLFNGFIDILGKQVGIKIYKEEDEGFVMYSFAQSIYLQNDGEIAPYHPGSGSMADSLEGILSKIELYKQYFRKIINTEVNPDF